MPRAIIQNLPYAVRFDNSTNRIQFPVTAQANFSFMIWVKVFSTTSSSFRRLVSCADGAGNGFEFGLDSVTSICTIYGNNGGSGVGYVSQSIDNNFRFVAIGVRVSGQNVKIFIDGMPANSGTFSNVLSVATGQLLSIGNSSFTLATSAKAVFSKFVFYNGVALTDSQMKAVYVGANPPTPTILANVSEGTGTTINDISGNANHGTLTGGTWTTDTPSKARTTANARMSVTNTNASLSILSNTNTPCRKVSATGISLASGTISFGLFFKMSNYNSNAYPHLINIGAEDELSVFWDKNVGNLNFKALAAPGGSIAEYMGVATAPYNTWNSLVVNYDGANIRGYLNGVLVYTKARTGSFAFTNTTINAGSNTGTSSINGNISNVFVSQNALTIEQINKFAKNMVLPSGSAIAWPLNEGAGTIAYDSSGNGNNGTITSGTWSADVPSKKRGVVGGNMIYNGDFSFVPMVNVPQTSGYAWLDGTSSGSGSNSLFGMAMFNYTGSYAAKFDITEKYNGNASLKLSTTGVASTVGVGTNLGDAGSHAKNNIPCSPNTSYTITFYMKTNLVSGSASSGALARLGMFQGNGTSGAGASTTIGLITTTTGWTKYTGTIVTSATARFLKTDFSVIGNDGAGTLIMDAWFSNIDLRTTTPTSRTASI